MAGNEVTALVDGTLPAACQKVLHSQRSCSEKRERTKGSDLIPSHSRGDIEAGSDIPASVPGAGWESSPEVPQEQNAQGSPSTGWEQQTVKHQADKTSGSCFK